MPLVRQLMSTGLSDKQIASSINAAKIKTRVGNEWIASKVRILFDRDDERM